MKKPKYRKKKIKMERKSFLYHVVDKRVDVLDPVNYVGNAICLSKNCFVGILGSFLYIFDYDVLKSNFEIHEVSSGGYHYTCNGMRKHEGAYQRAIYKYESIPLIKEYRIYEPIDVNKYAISVAENFNVGKGELLSIIDDKIIERLPIDKRV
jgi:hypothetical protein